MTKKQDKSVTEKLDEVYDDPKSHEADDFVNHLQEVGRSMPKDRRATLTSVGIDLGDPKGDTSASAIYLPCPHCNELINLETYKGLFFNEYLNRLET